MRSVSDRAHHLLVKIAVFGSDFGTTISGIAYNDKQLSFEYV
ncbi:hypothetical protein NIES2135_38920 [Leptolyngbya boryana NIES-2135]|jgi:hypothetical protein|uniref:Uncharacterized protein n=1 Tax=Leptolyngbya boryana NIES-2135 TaxID=1973484 RepID=A0A1Z4JJV6_LEPBY|nr:hypothetical protein NIES2135_38920 [Leptolyngbya boryana NIES-2135]